jgi:hypothetical protein
MANSASQIPLVSWYDHSRSKDENVATLLDLLERREPDTRIMVRRAASHR